MSAGFLGLLDFTGLPTGGGVSRPGGRGFRGLASHYLGYVLSGQRGQDREFQKIVAATLERRLASRALELEIEKAHQRMLLGRAVWTVALTEF